MCMHACIELKVQRINELELTPKIKEWRINEKGSVQGNYRSAPVKALDRQLKEGESEWIAILP